MAQHDERDLARTAYPHRVPVQTRWIDNDLYGHVNNAVYYHYFDTVVNCYLMDEGGLNIFEDDIIAFIVSSGCQFLAPVAYPMKLEGGMRVNRLGRSSVEYGVAIFAEDSDSAAAYATFTHVFVDRRTQTSVEIPPPIRAALERIVA